MQRLRPGHVSPQPRNDQLASRRALRLGSRRWRGVASNPRLWPCGCVAGWMVFRRIGRLQAERSPRYWDRPRLSAARRFGSLLRRRRVSDLPHVQPGQVEGRSCRLLSGPRSTPCRACASFWSIAGPRFPVFRRQGFSHRLILPEACRFRCIRARPPSHWGPFLRLHLTVRVFIMRST